MEHLSGDDYSREASEAVEAVKSLALEAGRRALAMVATAQAGPAAGLAVGVALAAAIRLAGKRRKLRSQGVSEAIASAIDVNAKLEELYERREKLLQAREAARTPAQRRMVDEALRSTDSMISDLEEMLELIMLIEEARRRVSTVLGDKAAREVDRIVARAERGEVPSEELYKLLAKLNEEVERSRLGASALSRLLG
ncbi:MAG: hypothetical protein LRS49_06090 [Desulfurococcales archaeon]|nr:hypothetical protein [Desulfurococcales archaeon]